MSLLGRVFRRRRSAAAPPPPAPAVDRPAPPPAAEAPVVTAPAPRPVVEVDEPAPAPSEEPPESDDAPDEAEDEGAAADDPTIGRHEPLHIDTADPEVVSAERLAAERLALSGPQRVTPNDPAGPGSLAEVLVGLEARGLVASEVVEDPELGIHLLYRPVGSAAPVHPAPETP